jgi:hypothetical protein
MTSNPAGEPLGLLNASLDVPTDDAFGQVPGPDGRWPRRWRGLLVWSATSAPVALLLTAGIALGPRGINLLSSATLPLLDPVVPVALAALGVLVGLGVGERRTADPRVFGAGCLVAAITMLVVSAGFAAITLAPVAPIGRSTWILILISGICAATSLTLPTNNPLEPRTAAIRVMEVGVLLPMVSGGLVLACLRAEYFGGAALLIGHACGVILALAAAAWLLLTRASSETEERVFALSALLLVGGVAGALAVSALFGGLVAGAFWRYAGRSPRETIDRDVLFVQHSLLVFVLLVAGARAELSAASLALGAGYVALRVVGQLGGGTMVSRLAGVKAPRDLGLHLLPPGVFGVALALNTVSIVGAEASMLLAAVVVGTIGADLVALLLPARSVGE